MSLRRVFCLLLLYVRTEDEGRTESNVKKESWDALKDVTACRVGIKIKIYIYKITLFTNVNKMAAISQEDHHNNETLLHFRLII